MDNMEKDLIKLHKDYTKLYQDGLIGVSSNYVQITPELFSDLRKGQKVTMTQDGDGFVELQFVVDKLRVITLI